MTLSPSPTPLTPHRLSLGDPIELDTEQFRLESPSTNATGHSSDNEQHHGYTCKVHIQLAATNLTRE